MELGNKAFLTVNVASKGHIMSRKELSWASKPSRIENNAKQGQVKSRNLLLWGHFRCMK